MAVAIAVLLGILIGLCVRPILDAYLRFRMAELYRDGVFEGHDEGVRHER